MLDDDTVEPRKIPTQQRSRATFDAIVEAAARILASEGVEGLNTNRVAEVAGVSVGSLYQYFPNKASIVARLIEVEIDRDIGAARRALEALDDASVTVVFELLTDQMLERAGATRDLHAELLPLVALVDRERLVKRAVEEFHELFVDFLWRRRAELHDRFHDDRHLLERRVWLASQMVRGGIDAAKVRRRELVGSPELREMVLDLFERELLPRE